MKLVLRLLVFCFFCSNIFGQEDIYLEDTMIASSSIFYYHYPIDYFPADIESQVKDEHGTNIRRYRFKPKTFFWDTLATDTDLFNEEYIYTYEDVNSGSRGLCYISENNEVYQTSDTLYLTFKNKKEIGSLLVPLIIQNLQKEVLTFTIDRIQYGYSSKYDKYISLWPYQTGVLIHFADSIYFDQGASSDYYRLNEKFSLNDATYLQFTNYRSDGNKVELQEGSYNGKVYGYKPGTYIYPDLHISDQLTVLYFGGHWCGPCKKENPRLLKMQEISLEKVFFLRTYLTYESGTKEEASKYYMENLFPIDYRLVELDSYTTHKLNAHEYPLYILIDMEEKILYRSDIDKGNFHFYFWEYLKKI